MENLLRPDEEKCPCCGQDNPNYVVAPEPEPSDDELFREAVRALRDIPNDSHMSVEQVRKSVWIRLKLPSRYKRKALEMILPSRRFGQ